jgi:hypothetical protein
MDFSCGKDKNRSFFFFRGVLKMSKKRRLSSGSRVSDQKSSQNGGYQPSKTAQEVIALLSKGYSPEGIAKARNTTIRAVNKLLRKLRKKGLLDATNVPVCPVVPGSLDTLTVAVPVLLPVRLHAIMVSARLKAGSGWLKDARKIQMQNGVEYSLFEFRDVKVSVFRSGRLIGYLPEFRGKNSKDVDAQFVAWLLSWFDVFEQAFNARFERDVEGLVVWKLCRRHYAYEGHVFGEAVKEVTEGADIEVRDIKGDLRLWTDESKGPVDLEVARGSDARRIVEGRIREYLVEDRLLELDKTVGRVVQLVSLHDDMLKGKGGSQ